MGLCNSILHSYICSCLMWNSEQLCYLWTFLQREMTYWYMIRNIICFSRPLMIKLFQLSQCTRLTSYMIDKRICFSRPLMTTLFQLWQCPRLTWLFQVCPVFPPFSVVVPPVASLVNANIKVFSLLAAGSGGVFCLYFSPFIWKALLAKWAECSMRIILSFSDPSTSSLIS